MNLTYAFLLGILQGATEFLPISSSGHLVLAERYLGVEEVGLSFDVALHMGTLLAVLVYFRKDFLNMAKAVVTKQPQGGTDADMRRIFGYLCLATIPGVLAGLVLGDYAETVFRHEGLVAVTLVVFGLLLLIAERQGKKERNFARLDLKDALLIGLAQAIAIVPGVSRSGITMTAGLFCGLDRRAVARFSFLMSAPIIGGAGFYNAVKMMRNGLEAGQLGFYVAGFAASAISGYLFIAFLMKYIQTRSFAAFAYYRFCLAALVIFSLLL